MSGGVLDAPPARGMTGWVRRARACFVRGLPGTLEIPGAAPYARSNPAIWIASPPWASVLPNRLTRSATNRENDVRPKGSGKGLGGGFIRGLGAFSIAAATFGLLCAAPAMAQEKKITVWFGK